MNLAAKDALVIYLDALRERPKLSEGALEKILVLKGSTVLDAALSVRFVPIGFAFAFLKHMGFQKFPLVFKAQDKDGEWQSYILQTQDSFAIALQLADSVVTKGYIPLLDKALFENVLARSAELAVVQKAIDEGTPIEDVIASELDAPKLLGISVEDLARTHAWDADDL